MKRLFIFMLTIAATLFVLAACSNDTEEETNDEQVGESEPTIADNPNYPADVTENPIVTITMNNDEKIVLELEPKVAPNTVANFISLVEDGFYDGLIFHRVIPGFMIQGGDPEGNGTGGPGYAIAGEFASNGFDNAITHERGVISMARSQSPDSAGSQFFIMAETSPHLDGEYAAFGRVIEGLEVVDAIVSVDRNGSDKPNEPQIMKTVTVDTKGYEYLAPVKK